MKPEAPGLLSTTTGLLGDARDLLAERARELVGGAAGRERHDEGERLVGVLRGGGQGERGDERAEREACERDHGRILLPGIGRRCDSLHK